MLTPPLVLHSGKPLLQLADGLDELDGVVVVLLDAGADGEDVRVEDDVAGREADLLGQQPVGPLADGDLVVLGDGLAFLVEGHHDDRGAVALDQPGLFEELLLAFLEADRVDDRLALDALQARLDDRPLRAVDHDRDAGDVGLGGDQVEEAGHRLLAVDQPLVHVDVEDVGAALDLLAGDGDGLLEVALADQPGELARAGDVGPLADHDEVGLGADRQRLQPAVAASSRSASGRRAGRSAFDGLGDLADVLGGGAAAAADDVQPAVGGELAEDLGHVLGRVVEVAEAGRAARRWGGS